MRGGDGRRVIGDVGLLVPVRCFTCGAPLGDIWYEYQKRVARGEEPGKVLDELGVKRYCCRRTLLSAVPYLDELSAYTHIVTLRKYKLENRRW